VTTVDEIIKLYQEQLREISESQTCDFNFSNSFFVLLSFYGIFGCLYACYNIKDMLKSMVNFRVDL